MSEARLRIEPVENSEQFAELLALPERIYGDSPGWVPPMQAWVRFRLSQRNPYMKDARLRLFTARRSGEVVGTISVMRDFRHESHRKEKVCFFGFFETIEDEAVGRALLEHAEAQAKEWGATVLRGPRNLSRVEEMGLCIEGYDRPAPMLGGHHPPYYRPIVEAFCPDKHHDVLAYDIELYTRRGIERPIPTKLIDKAEEVEVPGLEVRPFEWAHVVRDLDLSYRIFVDAFRDVPDNTPMPKAQFMTIMGTVLGFTDRHLLQLATVDGEPAGFALCFPDLYEASVHARGHLWPTGWARMLVGTRSIRTGSFKLLGVLPEHRGTGLHALLICRAIRGLREAGYSRLEASLIDERNGPMRHIVESTGCEVYKRYRVYERRL